MKLIYIANMRLPTEKAHGLEVMKLCEAFSKLGFRAELVIPWSVNRIKDDPFEFYRVEKNFSTQGGPASGWKIKKLPANDFLFLKIFPRFFFLVRAFSFSLSALVYFFFKKISGGLKETVFFSHDHIPLYFISFLGLPFIFDIHDFPEDNFLYKRVLKKAVGFGVQTKWKIQELQKRYGIPPEKVVYWPNGVEIKEFDLKITKEEARQNLIRANPNLIRDNPLILYTGHFFSWKGTDTLALASAYLDENCIVYFVGGAPEDIGKFKTFVAQNKLDKVRIAGFRPHEEIPFWLKAADVLVLPNTAKEDISKFYTSPMKLFEYMAAERPIVASDIPSIAEILYGGRRITADGEKEINADAGQLEINPQESDSYPGKSVSMNAVLVEPDNPRALAEGIKKVLADKNLADEISKQAYADVQKYTWTARAEKLAALFKKSKIL